MKYIEMEGRSKFSDTLSILLYNRGIKDVEKYTNLDENCLHSYNLLDNIDKAVECLNKHIDKKSNISILVDCDVDGYTSASLIYRYLKENSNCELRYILHDAKKHGLSQEITIPKGTDLLIIADAGTNDVKQCKELSEQGIDIIILDHHEKEYDNDYAIIVNNQMCSYPNKNLSGVGIVWKFIQALDDENWTNFSYECLDIVALGLISDCMDVKEYETRYLINVGISHINSPLMANLIKSQEYSIKGEVTINAIQYYITPILNALIRVGEQDEKDILFNAFIETPMNFKYKRRGEDDFIDENIFERACRFCKNAHSRQKRLKDKTFDVVAADILKRKINNNPIIVENVTDICDTRLSGVVAIQVANHFSKPVLFLRKVSDDTYSGSCRNIENGYIDNFKEFLLNTNLFEEAVGHASAFGATIKKENIPVFNKLVKEKFKDTSDDKKYLVDFVFNTDDADISSLREIDNLKYLWGTGLKEPYVAIKDIVVAKKDFLVMGKEENSWKTELDTGVCIVKFKCKNDKILEILKDDSIPEETEICIDVVGKVNQNFYNNIITMQIIVDDLNLKERK